MLKLIIAAMVLTGSAGAASAQKYYMRAALPSGGFPDKTTPSEPVDDHVYRWSQSTPVPGGNLRCVAGFKTTTYLNQCYDQTAGVIVADAKCPTPVPEPLTKVWACTLNCSTLASNKMPPEPGKYLGTATASGARTLCNKEPAQDGICYRDTTTSRVTFGYSPGSTILASSKSTDTAVWCGAQPDLMPLP